MPTYRYYYGMRLRGFSPGAQPKGVVAHWSDPTGKYYDIIVYNRLLEDSECFQYDLDYIDCKPYTGEELEVYYIVNKRI